MVRSHFQDTLYSLPLVAKVVLTIAGGAIVAIACEEVLFQVMGALFGRAHGAGMLRPAGILAAVASIPVVVLGVILLWSDPEGDDMTDE